MDVDAIARALDHAALGPLIKDIGIPPRPSLLADLQAEAARDDPDLHKLATLAASDVAVSAALLKLANSPLMGLSRSADNVLQAFMLLGMQTCMQLLTELALRQAVHQEGPALTRFWDVSAKRAHAMNMLSRRHGIGDARLAHSFGLFCDAGIPILIKRFVQPASYLVTLADANASDEPFTDIEQARHQTDHTVIGALLSRTWGLSQTVTLAIRLHHDYRVLEKAEAAPASVQELVALGLVVERFIQAYAGLNRHAEWEKGGEAALHTLGLGQHEFEEWRDQAHELFDRMG